MPQNKIIEEGLRKNDLADMVYPVFEVDTFRSKMGEDRDVCVVTFQAKDRYPARDMMEFIEKGYPFVLDADVSAGENEEGEYSIFVEIERNSKIADQIQEMVYGLSNLTGIQDWKFTYYKNKKERDVSRENLKQIPTSSKIYEQTMQKFQTNEMKTFFNKTLMDDLILEDDTITIVKPFGVSYKFKVVDETLEETNATSVVDENSMAEIFWLTKVMGNYNIEKVGDNFVFTNEDKKIVLKRV